MNADKAIKLIEDEFPNCVWNLSNVINDRHSLHPYGKGVSITLKVDQYQVWQKTKSDFLDAAEKAISRMHRRLQGEIGA